MSEDGQEDGLGDGNSRSGEERDGLRMSARLLVNWWYLVK